MIIRKYDVIGFEGYLDILSEIQDDLVVLKDPNYYYECALNEAVCNAARYSVDGIQNAKITIDMRISGSDVETTVSSHTRVFDVIRYRNLMRQLANDPKYGELDWVEYTGLSEKSRGIWMMLTACDHLYYESHGQSVTLCARIPTEEARITKKIKSLLPKFLVLVNGVVQ